MGTVEKISNQKNNIDERSKILMTLTGYLALYPHSKLDSAGLVLYTQALLNLGFTNNEISMAMNKLLLTSKFYPTVVEIVETIRELALIFVEEERVKDVDMAWMEVYQEVRRCFVYKKPHFSTPEIAETVKNLGWETLCSMTNAEVVRAQFERFYKIALKRNRDSQDNMLILHNAGNTRVRMMVKLIAERRMLVDGLAAESKSAAELLGTSETKPVTNRISPRSSKGE